MKWRQQDVEIMRSLQQMRCGGGLDSSTDSVQGYKEPVWRQQQTQALS